MASLICEGIGETRRGDKPKFFCVAKSVKTEKDYFDAKVEVVCPPEIQEICLARVIANKSKSLSRSMENEKDPKIVIDTGR